MHLPGLRLLAQPILQSALAAATIGAAALLLGKLARIRVEPDPTRARTARRR